jgi:hypothetical protein
VVHDIIIDGQEEAAGPASRIGEGVLGFGPETFDHSLQSPGKVFDNMPIML